MAKYWSVVFLFVNYFHILAYLTVENADFNAELYGEQAYPRNGHDESI